MADHTVALDILTRVDGWPFTAPSLIVIVGAEPFITGQMLLVLRDALCPDEADRSWAWREFNGADELDPRDVFDEAATVPLFGGATRAAIVRDADPFVTAAREQLEKIVATPRGSRGVVILEVRSFPANTRLAKAAAKDGLVIDASIPARYDLVRWVRQWAQSRHGVELAAATAQRLIDRLAGHLGQIDQTLQRLAAAIPADARKKVITPDAIDEVAGSPQERTAWGMIDAAAAGRTPAAVAQLAELLDGGENPIAIGAQMASVLRRLSTAARLLALPPAAGRPAGIEPALREAGVAAWPKALAQAKDSLLHLGGSRARQLPAWLLELDRSLKAESSRGWRARLALERFFCKMNGPAGGTPPSAPRSGARS